MHNKHLYFQNKQINPYSKPTIQTYLPWLLSAYSNLVHAKVDTANFVDAIRPIPEKGPKYLHSMNSDI